MNKKKNIAIISSAVVIFALAITTIILLLSTDENSIDKNKSMLLEYVESDVIASNEYYNSDLKYMEAILDDSVAYSLDYNSAFPCASGEELQKLDMLTGITVAGLLYGYPNVSAEELGVENDNEARMATQFAIWRLAQIEGVDDYKTLEYIFDMRNIKAHDDYEEYIDRVKVAAQNIVDKATEKPYYANPTFNIVGEESKIRLINDNEMVVGPYLLGGFAYDVTNIEVSLVNAPESAILCDKDGIVKSEFSNGEEVYVKIAQNVGEVTFTLRVDTEGVHYVAFAYGTGVDADNKQNFCVLEELNDELDALIDINLPEISEKETEKKVMGQLKVVSIDENKEKTLEGITYEILDENKNVIETLTSDKNGEILSKEMEAGTYYFREISGPDNICIDSTEREFNIINSNVIEMYTILHYYAKAKIQLGCTNAEGNKIIGAVYEIYNVNNELVDTVKTDANGIAISKYLLLGEYYYKCISAPDNVVIDDIKYDFELSKNMQILECWIEFENK